ncbi:MAG: hypothetical protein SFZ03_09685 [Candidatus Melainabacteria bacterium]|nr:hypothetical protein [Candidatus Melainabacteria bacterium]
MEPISLPKLLKSQQTRLDVDAWLDLLESDWKARLHCVLSLRVKSTGLHLQGTAAGNCQWLVEEPDTWSEPFSVSVGIDEAYVFEHYVSFHQREQELLPEDFFETIDPEGVLDLKDVLRQLMILELSNLSANGISAEGGNP